MDIVIFAPDLIEYAFVDVSLSEQTLWEESIQMNRAMRFTNVHARFNCYLTHKKHVLNYFALKMAAIIVAWRRHRRTESVW